MHISQLFLFFLPVSISMAWTGEPQSCAKVETMQRVPSTASGRWYLVAVEKKEMMDKKRKQPTMGEECSGFSSEPPCSCTTLDMDSVMQEPFIPEYNITGFSYNTMSGKYDIQYFMMKLVDNSSTAAMFEADPKDGSKKVIIRGLATDDHQTFMLLYLCSEEDTEMDVWFLSRSPVPPDSSVEAATNALRRNNMTMSGMTRVTHTDCVYPPLSEVRRSTKQAGFRVF